MNRRSFGRLATGAALWPAAARAQRNPESPKVGMLSNAKERSASAVDVVVDGLRASGFAPSQVELVLRYTEGDPGNVAPMVAEIIGKKVSVFVAAGPANLRAAREATSTVPIVAYDFETDPVAAGYAANIARPGGNVTGVFLDLPEFSGKWIELLRECMPRLSRVALVWDPSVGRVQVDSLVKVAAELKMTTDLLEVRVRSDLEGAFAVAKDRGAAAAIVLSSPLMHVNVKDLADLSLRHRLPAITLFAEFPRTGGLISYGPSLLGAARQAGFMAGKVLAGSMPATMPIERPSKFELILNRRTAEALGVTIPGSVEARADEVIE
jgi:putative tryptophan/tyrosine transport system substrate-binding protein